MENAFHFRAVKSRVVLRVTIDNESVLLRASRLCKLAHRLRAVSQKLRQPQSHRDMDRGSDAVRYGFEFTIPLTLSRWYGGRQA